MVREPKKEEYARRIAELEQALTECRNENRSLQEKENRLALDEKGNIAGAGETFQDVTKRKQTEEALRNSERRLGILLNFVPYPLVVFTLEGNVTYVNRGFTRVFGWTLNELEGKNIPYVPLGYEEEHKQRTKQLYEEKILYRHESKRLTKDGRILDVAIRATLFYEEEDKPAGELVLFRDITKEKKIARINETLLRISMALPNYQELENLLEYINEEVKVLLDTEGCVVVLVDEEKNDLYVPAAVYDKQATEQKIKKHHFSMDELLSGQVIRTGEAVIVSDLSDNKELHRKRDEKFGYQTRNMLIVPLKSRDRIIGTLCAINKKPGSFESMDLDILKMLGGTVALSVENAKFSRELKDAYEEVAGLNRAKDKAINHLSHELKTPLAVALGTLKILARRLGEQQDQKWETTLAMIQRNLNRIVDIQYEVDDIMRGRSKQTDDSFALRFDQCADLMENVLIEEGGDSGLAVKVKKRINEIFGTKELVSKSIPLDPFIRNRLTVLRPQFSHRQVEILLNLEPAPNVFVPEEILQKVFEGLLRNAIENTPDEGKVKVLLVKQGAGAGMKIRDYGVGIPSEAQKRIFEGFFPTRDTMLYSSKKPFDFNAGGKGADLLRMKIFSEQYHFKIDMISNRCRHIPKESNVCPGRISRCKYCKQSEDCSQSGGTTFSVYFPPAL